MSSRLPFVRRVHVFDLFPPASDALRHVPSTVPHDAIVRARRPVRVHRPSHEPPSSGPLRPGCALNPIRSFRDVAGWLVGGRIDPVSSSNEPEDPSFGIPVRSPFEPKAKGRRKGNGHLRRLVTQPQDERSRRRR